MDVEGWEARERKKRLHPLKGKIKYKSINGKRVLTGRLVGKADIYKHLTLVKHKRWHVWVHDHHIA